MGIGESGNPARRRPTAVELKPLFALHAELCKALANEHRLAILYALGDGEKRVTDLAAELDISVHNLSQHLGILKQRGVTVSRREGQNIYYSISNPKFVQACTLIRQALVDQHRAQDLHVLTADLMDAIEDMASPGGQAGGTA
jgi:ArsR family transcriptional regulator, virulence genes transcriptional regulator